MNRFVSATLAGAMALSVVGVSATGASADRWHHHYGPSYGPAPRHDDVGPALLAGTIFGLAVGSMMQPQPTYRAYAPPPSPPHYAGYAAERHFQWCSATYETYNGETDTWIDYRGVQRRCIGP